MDLHEAATRSLLINPQLAKVDWNLADRTQVRFEVSVSGYDPTPWNGFTDFCLYDATGCVVAVVEAKRTARDPREGEEQLRVASSLNAFGTRSTVRTAHYSRIWFETKRSTVASKRSRSSGLGIYSTYSFKSC
jgi:type I restriction enzyme, R subunit